MIDETIAIVVNVVFALRVFGAPTGIVATGIAAEEIDQPVSVVVEAVTALGFLREIVRCQASRIIREVDEAVAVVVRSVAAWVLAGRDFVQRRAVGSGFVVGSVVDLDRVRSRGRE
jgi:hypothetical protein